MRLYVCASGWRWTIEARKKAKLAAKLARERKAQELCVLDMRKLTGVCDYFVICSVSSQRQGEAVADFIETKFKEEGLYLRSAEGKREGTWILMDYFDVVIHIFFADVRKYYALEGLWQDAKRVSLPRDRKKNSPSSGRDN